ncbi:MAG: glycosyltransferase [Phycisphaerae bacterium]
MLDDSLLLIISASIAGLWLLGMVQGTLALWSGVRFYRYMRRWGREPLVSNARPPAVVILPCCGVDERLEETIRALGAQDYEDYEVIFTFESADDPAHAAVGDWAAAWSRPRWRRVVAGSAEGRSQKVHNLLAAVEQINPSREIVAFLDSDALPGADWLRRLTAPLSDPAIGAATGFRWYRAAGGLVSGLRSAWNAASISYLHDPRIAFCWGGSSAMRLETFRACRVPDYWKGAVSDDLQLTRALRDAGLAIHFVPQCLVSCEERMNWSQFVQFARRQLIITRIGAPYVWRSGFALAANYVFGTTATFGLAVYMVITGQYAAAVASAVAWQLLLLMARAQAILRQAGVMQALRPPEWTWRDWAYDVLAMEHLGVIHLGLLISTIGARRIEWRGITYELRGLNETRILSRRRPASPPPAAVETPAEPCGASNAA